MHAKFKYRQMNVRFELSAHGKQSFPGLRGGKIMGESRDRRCWIVLVDGNKWPYSIAKSFVRVLPSALGQET
jgi:hypothetical protein